MDGGDRRGLDYPAYPGDLRPNRDKAFPKEDMRLHASLCTGLGASTDPIRIGLEGAPVHRGST